MRLTYMVARHEDGLERIRPEWIALAKRSGAGPMMSPTWLVAWWRVFGRALRRRLAVLQLYRGDHLVGLVPLVQRLHWYPPAIPFRRLEWVGVGEPRSDEVCSEYMQPVAEPGLEQDVAEAFVKSLTSGALGAWDELVLPAIDGSGPWPDLLRDALARARLVPHCTPQAVTVRADLRDGFDAFLGSLSASNRYLVRKSLRDFETWAGPSLELRCAESHADLETGRDILARLHRARWADGGAFERSRFAAFHAHVMPALLSEGRLQLLWVSAHGEPVASVYNIMAGDTVYFYQSGRRIDLPNKLRPGIVLHTLAMRHAIACGAAHYDFLGGESPYKRQLGTSERQLCTLRVSTAAFREQARGLALHARDGARRLVRFAPRTGEAPS